MHEFQGKILSTYLRFWECFIIFYTHSYSDITMQMLNAGKTCVVQWSTSCQGVKVWNLPIGYAFFPATIGTKCIHVEGMPKC